MKYSLLAPLSAAALFAGCASSNHLANRIQTITISEEIRKPTTVIAPAKASDFSAFAARESAQIEREVRANTLDAIRHFGRFQPGAPNGSDATITFDAIRHGLTSAGGNLYAPTVEADIRATGIKGEQLLRRSHSATSGEIHTLDQFVKDPGLYRNAISVALQKLALEVAGDL
jgi:hypothetical protein